MECSKLVALECVYQLKVKMCDEQLRAPAAWMIDFRIERIAHDLNERDEKIIDEAVTRLDHIAHCRRVIKACKELVTA